MCFKNNLINKIYIILEEEIMWLFFGTGAFMALVLNIMFYMANKNSDIFRFISISLTTLTVCDFYAQNKIWVLAEDWSALMDVVPITTTMLWILVGFSILLNSISLIKRK